MPQKISLITGFAIVFILVLTTVKAHDNLIKNTNIESAEIPFEWEFKRLGDAKLFPVSLFVEPDGNKCIRLDVKDWYCPERFANS